jgi:hypothetical protein
VKKLLALAVVALVTGTASAQTDVRDRPGGTRLLFIDGNDIRDKPGGTRLLFIDGNDIRDKPGGTRLLFVDGKDVRPAPGGLRLAYWDGATLRRKPGGRILVNLDGWDIREPVNGNRLYFLDGQRVSRAQLVAVLYQLEPTLFKLSAEEEAQLKKERVEAERERSKDEMPGKYDITAFWSTAGDSRSGTVLVERKGEHYVLTFKFRGQVEWQGVGVRSGDDLYVALGPANTVGLCVYRIDGGTLDGTWVPCDAPGTDPSNLGSEKLSGPAKLGGTYKITSAKAPKTGQEYGGTVTLLPQDVPDYRGRFDAYALTWDLGGTKIPGVGIRVGNSLLVSSGTAKDFQVVRFQLRSGNLIGDWYGSNRAAGYYTLIR